MIRAAALVVLAAPALAQEMPVPSGLPMTVAEVLMEPESGTFRLRFLAPDLGTPGREQSDIEGDFTWLCTNMALPALARLGQEAQQVVISIADRPVAFGETAPEAVQYFEGFRIEDGACIWEPY